MHKFIIPVVATLISIGPVRAGEMRAVAPVPPDQTSPFSNSPDPAKSATQQLEDALRTELGRVGLTDIHVIPMSVLVQAKDADGNPVTFLLSPKSLAEPDEAADGASPDGPGTRSIPGEEKF